MPRKANIMATRAFRRLWGYVDMDEDAEAYRGCTEALVANPKRRACWDDRCSVKDTCQLWQERQATGFAIRAMTWRKHWYCFNLPCDYYQEAAHG